MIQIHKDKKCGQCHAVNQTRMITRQSGERTLHILQCIFCGHERVEATTYTSTWNGGYVPVTLPPELDYEVF